MPEMYRVKSSNICSIGYEDFNRILYVKFLDNSIYAYYKVPKDLFEQMLKSSSKGKFLHNCIKGRFSYKKIF